MANSREDEIEEARKSQLRILLNAIREAVNDQRVPKRVKDSLTRAVKSAKALSPMSANAESDLPLEVGAKCKNRLSQDDSCVYEIVKAGAVIDGVQLWDVKVLKGDSRTPGGIVQHNVPEHYLLRL